MRTPEPVKERAVEQGGYLFVFARFKAEFLVVFRFATLAASINEQWNETYGLGEVTHDSMDKYRV